MKLRRRLYALYMNVWLHWRTVRLVYVTCRVERQTTRKCYLMALTQLFTGRFVRARFEYKNGN